MLDCVRLKMTNMEFLDNNRSSDSQMCSKEWDRTRDRVHVLLSVPTHSLVLNVPIHGKILLKSCGKAGKLTPHHTRENKGGSSNNVFSNF